MNVADLRVAPPTVNRHELKVGERAGGLHVRVSADDPDVIQVSFFAPPGILVAGPALKAIEQSFSRQEFRRVSPAEIGDLNYPARATESYVQELLSKLDQEAIRTRGFRIVLNYGLSAASLVLPTLIGELGVEMVALNAYVDSSPTPRVVDTARALDDTAGLVKAVGADLGVLIDSPAERLWLVDEHSRPIPPETALLLFVRELAASNGGGRLLVPINESRMVEEIADGHSLDVERTKASLGDLLAAATAGDVVFAGASGGGYVFPEFLPAYDAVMSLGKLLELVAHSGRALSALVEDLPRSTLVHVREPCPWSAKGLAMRQLIEAVKGMQVDNMDGIKVYEPDGWVQVLPDPDEPVFHVYAEGESLEDSHRLEQKYRALLDGFVSATA